MRQQIHRAIEQASGTLARITNKLRRDGALTDQEVMARYMAEHRGNPQAIVRFAAQSAPGKDPFLAGVEYERRMERLLEEKANV